MPQHLRTLQQMLEQIDEAAQGHDRVSVEAVVEAIGSRSFGPLLVVIGVVLVSPLSGVPGIPTMMGVVVFLTSVQILLGKRRLWLPGWLLRRSLRRDRLDKGLSWLDAPARWIDRALRRRLTWLIRGASVRAIAMVCVAIAIGLPVMELVPFSATGAGVALTAFGLSLSAHDGVLALVAFVVTAVVAGLILSAVI